MHIVSPVHELLALLHLPCLRDEHLLQALSQHPLVLQALRQHCSTVQTVRSTVKCLKKEERGRDVTVMELSC